MKSFATGSHIPRPSHRDWLRLLIPTVLWVVIFFTRPQFTDYRCMAAIETCQKETLNPIDRWVVGWKNDTAHKSSDWTQYAAGAFAIVGPAIPIALYGIAPWSFYGKSLILLTQITVWNGVINEKVRLIVQRPRPFVYADPANQGNVASHYTSFYSGHTSFAALASTHTFLLFQLLGASPWLLGWIGGAGLFLTALTGTLRVLAGVHFVTDVLTGALMGMLIAAAIHFQLRRKLASEAKKNNQQQQQP